MSWQALPITKVARIVGGGTPSKANGSFWNGDIPWVSPKDMAYTEIADAEDHITQAAVEQSATQVVPPSSVLIVVRSGILARRLPVALAQNAVALNQDMKALICEPPLRPKFLAYFLQFKEREILSGFVKRGATVHSIEMSRFNRIQVPIPAPSEQRRIVEILDQADVLRKRAREADAKAARILPALFLKMFGDPATNPMGWPDKPLAKLCNPKQWPTISTRELKDSGFPVYGANGQIGFYDTYNHEYATVLITCRGATCGTVGVCAPKSYVTGNAMALDDPNLEETSIEFLKWFLRTRGLSDTITGSAQPQITRASLTPVRVFVPPKKLVDDFSKQTSDIEALNQVCVRAKAGIEALFSVLLSRAFSGRLTAKWREAHMQELLAEIQKQARLLNLPMPA